MKIQHPDLPASMIPGPNRSDLPPASPGSVRMAIDLDKLIKERRSAS